MRMNVKERKRKEVGIDGVLIYLLAIAANLAAQFLVSIAAEVADAAFGKNIANSDYFQFAAMLCFQIAFFSVPCIYYGVIKKYTPVLSAPLKKPEPNIILSLLLPVLCIAGFIIPAQYFSVFLYKIGYNLSAGINFDTPGKLAFGIILVVIIAPCVEELIFRGFLLSGLRTKFNKYAAAALCAAAFSLMHMNPEQTVYQFFLGFVCALAAIESGNLLAPIIIHGLSNLIAVLLDFNPIAEYVNRLFSFFSSHVAATVFIALGLALACSAAILFVCRLMGKLKKKTTVCGESVEKLEEHEEKESEQVEAKKFVPLVPPANGASKPQTLYAKSGKKTGLAIYIAAIGLCALMWVFVFVVSMM